MIVMACEEVARDAQDEVPLDKDVDRVPKNWHVAEHHRKADAHRHDKAGEDEKEDEDEVPDGSE